MDEDEEFQVLCGPREGEGRGRAIAGGAIHFLSHWPGLLRPDIFSAVLVGCLLAVGFVFLGLLPAFLTLESRSSCPRYRGRGAGYSGRPTNVYFLKHESRTWTREELCCVEAAARRYPQYNIFLINLVSDEDKLDSTKYLSEILEESLTRKKMSTCSFRNSSNSETKLRQELSVIPNFRSVDISVARFFARSIMSKRAKSLSSRKLELAAKFQVIWDSGGVALEPLAVQQLETLERFLNKNKIAIVQIENDVQAASVACQSFYGSIMSQMAKNTFTDRQSLLKHALVNFCPSVMDCLGVRIIEPISKSLLDSLSCPIVSTFSKSDNRRLINNFTAM